MTRLNRVILVTAALLCGVLLSVEGHAAPIVFTFDTTPLVGAGPVAFDLQLIDGDGPNTSVTLDLVDFGGGSVTGAPGNVGGASGSLQTTVTLTDTAFFNEFVQTFVAGSTLSFRLDIATTATGLPQPDGMQFAILNLNGTPLATSDPSGLDALFAGELTAGGMSGQSFELAVPEPATAILLALGLVGVLRRRFKSSKVQKFKGSRVQGFKGFEGSRVQSLDAVLIVRTR